MSDCSSGSSSDSEGSQNDSEWNYIPGYVSVEDEREGEELLPEDGDSDVDFDEYNYTDEPLADEEWIQQYNKDIKAKEDKQKELGRRLDGTELFGSWYVELESGLNSSIPFIFTLLCSSLPSCNFFILRCTCGNCDTQHLQNANECFCCQDNEKCVASLKEELVLEDIEEPPKCITLHPGFGPVCLEKWSLRISAVKYRRRDGKRYKKQDSEAG